MKRALLFSIFFVFAFAKAYTQNTPQAFNWQGVIKDATGNPLADTTIGLQFTIHQGSATGTTVYTQAKTLTTNSNGLINTVVGDATNTNEFDGIDWGSNNYYLEVGIDTTGGTTYTSLGAAQLLSVPYALYAGGNSVSDQIAAQADGTFGAQDTDPTGTTYTIKFMKADGNVLAVATNSELIIYDITNPANPVFADSYTFQATVTATVDNIEIVADKIFVLRNQTDDPTASAPDRSLYVLDISDPYNITQIFYQLNYFPTPNSSFSNPTVISESGSTNYIYTITTEAFYILDVSDASNPLITNTLPTINNNNGISSSIYNNGYLYIAGEAYELAIYDVSNPTSPAEIYDSNALNLIAGDFDQFTLIGNYLITLEDEIAGAKRIIDISNPSTPSFVTDFGDSNGVKTSFATYNNRFVEINDSTVDIYNLSNPSSPVLENSFTLQQNSKEAIIYNDYLYVLGADFQLYTYDLSFGEDIILIDAQGNISSSDLEEVVSSAQDNLGNHIATQDINLNGFLLKSDTNSTGGFSMSSYGLANIEGLSPRIEFTDTNNANGIFALTPGISTTFDQSIVDFEFYSNEVTDYSIAMTVKADKTVTIGDGTSGDLFVSNELSMTNGNIKLNNNWLSNDGDNEGIQIDTNGAVTIDATSTLPLTISGNNATKLKIEGNTNDGQPAQGAVLELNTNRTSGTFRGAGIEMSNRFDDKNWFAGMFYQDDFNNYRIGYYDQAQTGTNNFSGYVTNAVFTLSSAGNLNIAGTLTQNSDRTLKTDIQPLTNTLDKISQINGYYYRWKDAERRGDKLQLGVIAQEVQAVYPELVSKDESGILSVNYTQLSAVLLEAVKEQQQEIQTLQQNEKTILKRLEAIENTLNKTKN